MRGLDETDLAILSLLAEDARRSFRSIGDEVDLSGPAVSDRVQRLREAGIIERFTVDVDRSHLRSGVPVFVRFEDPPAGVDALRERLRGAEGVEHLFVTADGQVWVFGHAEGPNVRRWIDSLAGEAGPGPYEVTLVDEVEWAPSLEGTDFAIACAECGNTVDAEGTSGRVDGSVYHFCCSSCWEKFEDTYRRLAEDA